MCCIYSTAQVTLPIRKVVLRKLDSLTRRDHLRRTEAVKAGLAAESHHDVLEGILRCIYAYHVRANCIFGSGPVFAPCAFDEQGTGDHNDDTHECDFIPGRSRLDCCLLQKAMRRECDE